MSKLATLAIVGLLAVVALTIVAYLIFLMASGMSEPVKLALIAFAQSALHDLTSNASGIIAAIAAVLGSIWARRGMVDTKAGNKAIEDVQATAVETRDETATARQVLSAKFDGLSGKVDQATDRIETVGMLVKQATNFGGVTNYGDPK